MVSPGKRKLLYQTSLDPAPFAQQRFAAPSLTSEVMSFVHTHKEAWCKLRSLALQFFCWRTCLMSESMGHHDSEIMDGRRID
jgi:hypothetical protein